MKSNTKQTKKNVVEINTQKKSTSKTPEPKGRASKKGKADKPDTVRVASGYILYGKDERPKIVKEHPEFKAKEVITEIGKRWNNLAESVKNKYNSMSAGLKKEAEKEREKGKKKAAAPTKGAGAKGKKGKPVSDDDEDDE